MGSSGPLLFDRSPPPGRLGDKPFQKTISDAELAALLDEPGRKRSRLWDLSSTLHCSIIGTCLSTAELRQIVSKTKGSELKELSDHEIHGEGVRMAGRHDGAGKLLNKALDKRHQAVLNRFAKAETLRDVEALWDEAKRAGDIPGAYWAVLSHPATSHALVKTAFADVHMLSHLVGAANRADIRRLTALEAENAALSEKLQKSQARLQAADATTRQLDTALAAAVARAEARSDSAEAASPDAADAERTMLRRLVASLEARLATEAARRMRAEDRAEQAQRGRGEAEEAAREAEARSAQLAAELAVFERPGEDDGERASPLPAGLATLLYVGGRPSQVPQLRAFAEQAGIALLHHDGGIEDRSGLLAGLVSRADAACFPVDCVSHDAVAAVKRLCRQAGKAYQPLRSNGLGSLMVGLAQLAAAGAP